MLTLAHALEPLSLHRTDEVVVTTMSAVRPWGALSDSDLDFASADSAMGHAADLALGIALARPERGVICVNGDGSMLMSLGTLATVADAAPPNYLLVVCDNGTYEITGLQPVPAAPRVDYAALALASGFPSAHTFDEPESWGEALPEILRARGPTLVHLRVRPGEEGPISRGDHERARYLRSSLADWSRVLRAALTEKPAG